MRKDPPVTTGGPFLPLCFALPTLPFLILLEFRHKLNFFGTLLKEKPHWFEGLFQGGRRQKSFGRALCNIDDVIMVMTSLLPLTLQNIGGAAAPPAPPFATSLIELSSPTSRGEQ